MKLSIKALRIVAIGVSQLDDQAKKAWARWTDRYPDGTITPEIALVVDSALVALEHLILDNYSRAPEDYRPDMINDMGFIHAIQSDLKKELRN